MNRFAVCGLGTVLAVVIVLLCGATTSVAGGESPYALRTAAGAPPGMEEAVRADNPAQGLTAWIGPEAILVRPGESSGAGGGDAVEPWSVSLALQRVGRDGGLEEVGAAGLETDGARAELHRDGLVEWYVNGPAGLEQGFDLTAPPPGEAGRVVVELALDAEGVVARTDADGDAVLFVRPGSRLPVLRYGGLAVRDADGRSLPASLELASEGGRSLLRLTYDDDGARYPVRVDPLLTAASWSSSELDATRSLAWGDWDGDGDLDLAVGNVGEPNRVYENSGGTLAATAAWSSDEADATYSVAWGDWDGDGDLDLAVGNFNSQPNRVYENLGGTLGASAAWSSDEEDDTASVAWGDWNGDDDLDLAVGNLGTQANRVYENTGGTLGSSAAWSSDQTESTASVAWGDMDGDGDLDLAVGNVGAPNRVHRNTGATLTTGSVWSSDESDATASVAWGDWDGDGDFDLAVGNSGTNRVYENTGSALASAPIWSSDEEDVTTSVAWGDWDGDGDLDLTAGNQDTFGAPNRVYENAGAGLATGAAWSSSESDPTFAVAWGDWDGDGDLDLVAGNFAQPNRVYENLGPSLATGAAWTSSETDQTFSVAWGDWDGDGDLDLAVGSENGPNRVYENLGGTLSLSAAWSSSEPDRTRSVAWGDWDDDGDLDLAAGNVSEPNRVYENLGGTLSTSATWSSTESDTTHCVAWGDWDGDGDLDLATGNRNAPIRVYENIGGTLATSAVSSFSDEEFTFSVAWGDWDGDGDLDLAAGKADHPNRVYENLGGTLDTNPVWSSSEPDPTRGVAWGDWDGDGDLDLAAGNDGEPNRVYENLGGVLATVASWSSTEDDDTWELAWGDWDGDGDLDLAAGNRFDPNRVYENSGTTLATTAVWSSSESDDTPSIAWGDWDGDGDLDLAAGNISGLPNRVYHNGLLFRPMLLPETAVSPVIERRPGGTDAAAAYSSECLGSPSPVLAYSLVDEENDRARRVVLEYAVDGESWLPATSTIGDGTEDLPANPTGLPHQLVWDNLADGVTHAQLVRLRVTVPFQASTRLAGPIQRAAMRAVSPPFSLCVPAADLTVTLDDGATSATPGLPVNYTLTVANDGPDDAAGVTVTDTFPAALSGVTWTCADGGGGGVCATAGSGDLAETVDLPAGASVVFTIEATVDPAATGTLSDTASAALPAGLHELAPADNSATDLDVLVPSTDLAIGNDDGQATAVPGTMVTYTVMVTNAGPSNALEAQVVDLFPAALTGVTWSCAASGGGACTASGSGDIEESVDLPVGAGATFTATGTIDPAATGTLITSATVIPTFPSASTNQAVPEGIPAGGDPDPSNNTATDADTLTPQADLGVTKDDGITVALPGQELTYTITASNPGPSSVVAAAVEDVFPADLLGVAWTCAGAGGGTCTASGGGDIGDSVDLPAGASVTYTATATVDPESAATEIGNTATVTVPAGVAELNAADNAATDVDAGPAIFLDGFESGDTTAWSATAP